MSRVVKYRDSNTFVKLHLVYVSPILEYCIQAVGPHTVADKACLEKVQSRAVKMVSDIGGGTYSEKLSKLNLTTLEERRWKGDMIQTLRIMSGKDIVKVETWFDMEIDRQRARATTTQGGIMTGNLGTRFPRNLHPQPKYLVGVPLFDKICIYMNIFEQQMIK